MFASPKFVARRLAVLAAVLTLACVLGHMANVTSLWSLLGGPVSFFRIYGPSPGIVVVAGVAVCLLLWLPALLSRSGMVATCSALIGLIAWLAVGFVRLGLSE